MPGASHALTRLSLAGALTPLVWQRSVRDQYQSRCERALEPLATLLASPVVEARLVALSAVLFSPELLLRLACASELVAALAAAAVSEEATSSADVASQAALALAALARVDDALIVTEIPKIAPCLLARLRRHKDVSSRAPWLALACSLAARPLGREALLADCDEDLAAMLLPMLLSEEAPQHTMTLAALLARDESDGVTSRFARALIAGANEERVCAALLAPLTVYGAQHPTHRNRRNLATAIAALQLLAHVAPPTAPHWPPMFAAPIHHLLHWIWMKLPLEKGPSLGPEVYLSEAALAVSSLLHRTQPACAFGRTPRPSPWRAALVEAGVLDALFASGVRWRPPVWHALCAFAARGPPLRPDDTRARLARAALDTLQACVENSGLRARSAGEVQDACSAALALLALWEAEPAESWEAAGAAMLAGKELFKLRPFVALNGLLPVRLCALLAALLATLPLGRRAKANLLRDTQFLVDGLCSTVQSSGLWAAAAGTPVLRPQFLADAVALCSATLVTICALYDAPMQADAQPCASTPPGQAGVADVLEGLAHSRVAPPFLRVQALAANARMQRRCGARTALGEAMRAALLPKHSDSVDAPDLRFQLRHDAHPILAHRALLAIRCPGLLAGERTEGVIELAAAVTRPLLEALLSWAYTDACAAPESAADAAALASLARASGAHTLAALLQGAATAGNVSPPAALAEHLALLLPAADQAPADDLSLVELRPAVGSSVQAHRFVLAARSEYFRAAMQHSDALCLPELDERSVRALRRWLYSDALDLTDCTTCGNQAALVGAAAYLASTATVRMLPALEACARTQGEAGLERATPQQRLHAIPLAALAGDWQLASAAALAAARHYPELRASGALDEVDPRWADEVRKAHVALIREAC